MAHLTVATEYHRGEHFASMIELFTFSPLVDRIFVGSTKLIPGLAGKYAEKVTCLNASVFSGAGISCLLESAQTSHIMLLLPGGPVAFIGDPSIQRLLGVASDSGAGIVYCDFAEDQCESVETHPLIDYQLGSVRDNFDFGSAVLISREAALSALGHHGEIDATLKWGGFYDLRLK